MFDERNDVCGYIRLSEGFIMYRRLMRKKADVMFYVAIPSSILLFKVPDGMVISRFLFFFAIALHRIFP